MSLPLTTMPSVRPASPTPGDDFPVLKRQKVEPDDELEVLMAPMHNVGTPSDPVHDDPFYLPDGSCIIRVQDTLFNVHRSTLCKDSSSFSTMFALPQGGHNAEGTTDENPVILTGDSPIEFKDFLWSLYALPPELLLMHTPRADIVKLVNVAKVAHKYCFRSIESWSCDAILEYVSRQPSPFNNTANQEQLTMIIRLAHLCHQDKLLETSIQLMKQRIARSEDFLSLAMNLADELGITSLRGTAYFEALNRGQQFWIDSGIITQEQRLCLLYGYYRLSKEWERIRSVPPRFEHAKSCGLTWHSNQCMTSWNDFWKKNTTSDTLMNMSLADVGGRLRLIIKELDRWGQASYMHHECRVEAKKRVMTEIKAFEDNLPTFFTTV